MSATRGQTVAVGCDHAGVEIVKALLPELQAAGIEIRDLSPEPAADYPDAAREVGKAVSAGQAAWGILVCGTGIGMSITANKLAGIRAAVCADPYSARMSREHNDANVLCLGGRTLGAALAVEILRSWLAATPSLEQRHVRRRQKVTALEAQR